MPKKISYISSNKEIAAFITGSIEKSFKLYSKRFKLVKSAFSEESVHDIRVSIRRLAALVNLINAVLPNDYLDDVIKILKKQVSIFSPLRDTQVQLIKVEKLLKDCPMLEFYRNELLRTEEKQIEELKDITLHLKSIDLEGLIFFHRYYMNTHLEKYEVHFLDFVDVAYRAYMKVADRYDDSTIDNLKSVHKTRLAFKGFRYTMELLGPYLNQKKDYYMQLKSFQTIMGEIQDNCVIVDKMEAYIEKRTYLTYMDYNSAKDMLLEERLQLLKKYFGNGDMIKGFWKQEFMKKS